MAAARRAGDQEAADEARRRFLSRRRDDQIMMENLRRWWIRRMIQTRRPLEEKLALLWHGHFATRHRNVRDAYLMIQQNEFFRRHAASSFVDLARGIVRDPAMLRFLNNDRNIKRQPNENLARELMELFTLGEGHYTEKDIKEGARALTGYHVDDNNFTLRHRAHDIGVKRILGHSANHNGDDFVRILLRQKACGRFIALKLYGHFVADVGDDLEDAPPTARIVIEKLARLLRQRKYKLAPVLDTLLKSRHFYDPAIIGSKIKSPAQLLVGTARMLGTPERDARALGRFMRSMGQTLFDPPSVAGWDGGRGWVNTSTLFARQNLTTYLISGRHPLARRWRRDDVGYDPMPLVADAPEQTPEAAVNFLVDALLGPHIPPPRRQPLVEFMQHRKNGANADSVIALLLLITSMPEYQLC